MAKRKGKRVDTEPFGEKEFYLEEFRGRSVLIAVAPAVVEGYASLRSLGATVRALVQNDTRVLVWWPALTPASERRVLAALGSLHAKNRSKPRRGKRKRKKSRPVRRASPALRVRALDVADPDAVLRLRTALWARLRVGRLCVLSVTGPTSFPAQPMALAAALRIPKAVLVDPRGGLDADGGRLSFVDENVLETVLRQGEAEWTGLGDRRSLLMAVRAALERGVEQVNVCPPDGVAEELFTYSGSGTLFTEGDYTRVGPLGLDDFAQAERLLERGAREGVLKTRSAEEVAQLLSVSFGVTICGRHLAGVAGLLTAPYAAERAGEIVGLYTITRFKGEGLGERLVQRIVQEAEALGLDYVFACSVDEHARQFFERLGFAPVVSECVPAAKWIGYDVRRRQQVATLRRLLPARSATRAAEQAS